MVDSVGKRRRLILVVITEREGRNCFDMRERGKADWKGGGDTYDLCVYGLPADRVQKGRPMSRLKPRWYFSSRVGRETDEESEGLGGREVLMRQVEILFMEKKNMWSRLPRASSLIPVPGPAAPPAPVVIRSPLSQQHHATGSVLTVICLVRATQPGGTVTRGTGRRPPSAITP